MGTCGRLNISNRIMCHDSVSFLCGTVSVALKIQLHKSLVLDVSDGFTDCALFLVPERQFGLLEFVVRVPDNTLVVFLSLSSKRLCLLYLEC